MRAIIFYVLCATTAIVVNSSVIVENKERIHTLECLAYGLDHPNRPTGCGTTGVRYDDDGKP